MIDLIANGFALRKQKQVQKNSNPQSIRNKPASNNPHGGNKSAQSAYSAKNIDELTQIRSYTSADCAEYAENQSSIEYRAADLLRGTCGWDDFDLWEERAPKSLTLVQCDHCMHFTPDTIGSGAGIGNCAVGVKWTQQVHGRMPLYRYADRHCVQYKLLESASTLESGNE